VAVLQNTGLILYTKWSNFWTQPVYQELLN